MIQEPLSKIELTYLPEFDHNFFEKDVDFSSIGRGALGGKAAGLAYIKKIIIDKISTADFPDIDIHIPRLAVIRTEVFDSFMERNNLWEIAMSDEPDDRIAHAFIKADLPAEILGSLRFLIKGVTQPLAVRSSSLLEDAKYEPFAGIYGTKMISNNEAEVGDRFAKLVEAIKFIYASTFFAVAKEYFAATGNSIKDEKMAVIIQEVVGRKRYERFYPQLSGVARSYNYYPSGRNKPEQGVINLALGLGKTIVDGGICWSYSPAFPKSPPPFGDITDLMKNSQTEFWAVNMGHMHNYDPVNETEYMSKFTLNDADYDSSLDHIASTYSAGSNKVTMGIGNEGPRILNFAPLLSLNQFRFNDFIKILLKICEEAYKCPVEIEFAASFLKEGELEKLKFGFLQVRPMVVSTESVSITEEEMEGENIIAASSKALGNGIDNLIDVVFVKPELFDKKNTVKIAEELKEMNALFRNSKTRYLLIGFGRWGSSDPWLGIPVEWGQISHARVIVESTLPEINVDLSQGSHFFHNITSFGVKYLSLNYDGKYRIDWELLNSQDTILEKQFIKHIRFKAPLNIKIDGRTGKGIISL